MSTFKYEEITSPEDIEKTRSEMIRNLYPASMSDCEVVGINGDCGSNCPIFKVGKCPCPDVVES